MLQKWRAFSLLGGGVFSIIPACTAAAECPLQFATEGYVAGVKPAGAITVYYRE